MFIASLPGRTAAPGAVPITLTVFKETARSIRRTFGLMESTFTRNG